MPNVTIQIPAPTGLIDIDIRDSGGTSVYTATITNDPITIVLPAGSYTLYTSYNGAQNGWCFDVTDRCVCPTLQNVSSQVGSSSVFFGYCYFDFDMSAGFSCPFTISGTVVSGTTSTSFAVTINSLADFTSSVGSIYRRTIWIGGLATSVNYNISLVDSEAICTSGIHVVGDCEAPPLNSVTAVTYDDLFFARLVFSACGTCNDFTLNWMQTYPIVPIIPTGSYSSSVPCLTFPYTLDVGITPNFGTTGATAALFTVEVIDCCGITSTYYLSFAAPACDGPLLINVPPFSVLFKYTGIPSGRMIYEVQSGTCSGCDTATITYTQINSGIVGAADSGVLTGYDLCAQNYFLVSPNTSYPGYSPTGAGKPRYNVTIETCCGITYSQVSD